ncbi:MAG: imidazolonepropionase, partial [Rhodovibrionaceae bacterium]|nr:imidazolonepropionase [Rhodovibrionaceae bacterium]
MIKWDTLWINGHLATMTEGGGAYGALENAALAVREGRIAWLGPMSELPGAPGEMASDVRDLDGCWMTPGLIDCHTHLVWGGDRAREFELRLEGASYEELAKAG